MLTTGNWLMDVSFLGSAPFALEDVCVTGGDKNDLE